MDQSLHVSSYNPSLLLDSLCVKLNARNDYALAKLIGISPSVISKMRSQKSAVSAGFLVLTSEVTGVNTRTLRALMGDRRSLFRISDAYLPSFNVVSYG